MMGTGNIGGTVAFVAAMQGICDELVLYDSNGPKQLAQIRDIAHTGIDITLSSDVDALRRGDIFLFCAGTARTPAIRTRADLLSANLPVADDAARILRGFEGVAITVTNPMEANNWYIHQKSGLPRERCIGFGGLLDSARFGCELKNRGIEGEPWVLGEHGEFQVPIFSELSEEVSVTVRDDILTALRGASMTVVQGKGYTAFAPAYHICRLIRAILSDEQVVLPCSAVLEGEYGTRGCSMGVPCRIGRGGITEILEWEFDPWEAMHIASAAEHLKALCGRACD